MTQIRRSLVMVGDLPEPFGGVALHCYNVCMELSRRSVDVHFRRLNEGSEAVSTTMDRERAAVVRRTRCARTPFELAGLRLMPSTNFLF